MLENVIFVGFWDLNSITKKTNQNNWADHHMVSWIQNSEFTIPNYSVWSRECFDKKIITNKQTILFLIGSKIRETMHGEHLKGLNK